MEREADRDVERETLDREEGGGESGGGGGRGKRVGKRGRH